MMSGILYGTGTGPGDAELLTLKAVRTIRSCDMTVVPVSDSALEEPCIWEEGMPWLEQCTAYQIVLPEVPEIREKPVLCLPMPMKKDKETLKRIHDAGAAAVEQYLDEGKRIAFLTLGDPSVYSTYLYIHTRYLRVGYQARIIPGIPSFCAAAAALNIGLAENKEEIHILPASYGIEEGLQMSGTKILMKAGKQMSSVKETLPEIQRTVPDGGKLRDGWRADLYGSGRSAGEDQLLFTDYYKGGILMVHFVGAGPGAWD